MRIMLLIALSFGLSYGQQPSPFKPINPDSVFGFTLDNKNVVYTISHYPNYTISWSTNRGQSWSSNGPSVFTFNSDTVFPSTPDRFFVLPNGHMITLTKSTFNRSVNKPPVIFRSIDRGVHWANLSDSFLIKNEGNPYIYLNPKGRLFHQAYNFPGAVKGTAFLISEDGGENWIKTGTLVNKSLATGEGKGESCKFDTLGRVYCRFMQEGRISLFRSIDDGRTWDSLYSGQGFVNFDINKTGKVAIYDGCGYFQRFDPDRSDFSPIDSSGCVGVASSSIDQIQLAPGDDILVTHRAGLKIIPDSSKTMPTGFYALEYTSSGDSPLHDISKMRYDSNENLYVLMTPHLFAIPLVTAGLRPPSIRQSPNPFFLSRKFDAQGRFHFLSGANCGGLYANPRIYDGSPPLSASRRILRR